MVKAQNIYKTFGDVQVLRGVDCEVGNGEFVTIVGASGAGKTTLLQILGTLESPDSGQVWVDGINITSLQGKKLAQFRNKSLGFVFQFHHLLPEFTALENICMPAFLAGMNRLDAEKRGRELLAVMDLESRAAHKPSELSGGEQQRIAVARALCNSPKLILADEPSGNLDTSSADALHALFRHLCDTYHQTFLVVTHNQALAASSDRTLTMVDGKFVVSV